MINDSMVTMIKSKIIQDSEEIQQLNSNNSIANYNEASKKLKNIKEIENIFQKYITKNEEFI